MENELPNFILDSSYGPWVENRIIKPEIEALKAEKYGEYVEHMLSLNPNWVDPHEVSGPWVLQKSTEEWQTITIHLEDIAEDIKQMVPKNSQWMKGWSIPPVTGTCTHPSLYSDNGTNPTCESCGAMAMPYEGYVEVPDNIVITRVTITNEESINKQDWTNLP